MIRLKNAFGIGLCLGAVAITIPARAADSPTQQSATDACEIHIWQRGLYLSESSANFGALGLVGSILSSEYNRKYPPATVQGLMEDVLNIDALPATLSSIPWRKYTMTENNTLVFEHASLSNEAFEAVKTSTARNSSSLKACYIELYVGKQTFSGGSMKSHLFGEFYARTFYQGAFQAKTAILWDQTRKLKVTDEESLNAARASIRTAFVNTLNKFLSNKLPKRARI